MVRVWAIGLLVPDENPVTVPLVSDPVQEYVVPEILEERTILVVN